MKKLIEYVGLAQGNSENPVLIISSLNVLADYAAVIRFCSLSLKDLDNTNLIRDHFNWIYSEIVAAIYFAYLCWWFFITKALTRGNLILALDFLAGKTITKAIALMPITFMTGKTIFAVENQHFLVVIYDYWLGLRWIANVDCCIVLSKRVASTELQWSVVFATLDYYEQQKCEKCGKRRHNYDITKRKTMVNINIS